MTARTAKAIWEGDLKSGHGNVEVGSGNFKSGYSFATRFKDEKDGTNPEELIAAAHASCFSMALSHLLAEAGHASKVISTQARVHLQKDPKDNGFSIPKIDLVTEAEVADVDEGTFLKYANEAKNNCPVSKLLSSAEITLDAHFKSQ